MYSMARSEKVHNNKGVVCMTKQKLEVTWDIVSHVSTMKVLALTALSSIPSDT